MKTTMSNHVEFIPDSSTGEFTVRASWDYPKPGHYQRKFTRQFMFGPTLKIGVRGQYARLERKTCDLVKQFMREVLQSRGA